MKKFVCTTRCPELDNHMSQAHCIKIEEEIQIEEETNIFYCPFCRTPQWTEITE